MDEERKETLSEGGEERLKDRLKGDEMYWRTKQALQEDCG